MARSAALNPASMPFFPGGLRSAPEDDVVSNSSAGSVGFTGFGTRMFRGQDRNSVSSHSAASSEYRSVRNSPSPPQPGIQGVNDARQPVSPGPGRDNQRQSPTIRQNDAGKPYPGIESRIVREGSHLGSLGTLSENEEKPSPDEDEEHAAGSGHQTPSALAQQHHLQQLQQHQNQRRQSPQNGTKEPSPSLPFGLTNRSFSGATYSSSSPVSSLDSNSRATPSTDHQAHSFEAQLKASPIIHDILDRLVRSEYATREIKDQINDVNRKVNFLVERALESSQPEFKDPFAQASVAPTNNHLQHRPSIGNIAPNQAAGNDDISSISQRLNTLTSSVGQLLALQTQQMQHNLTSSGSMLPPGPESRASVMGLSTPQLELAPHQVMTSSGISNAALLNHGLPNRPDLRSGARQPNPPMRAWSASNLDLPIRASVQDIGRQESGLRDKRRSSGLLRRDSSGLVDPSGDGWAGGSRDNGPIITKWEQLNLAPELLRSLTKFGVGPPNKIQQRALPFLLRGSDIIAQAPPTQERIAAYVIPAIQVAVTNMDTRPPRGPIVIMVSTTVDQANQANRMIRDLGSPIGVKSALGVGSATSGNELNQELRQFQQNMPHIICGTPQKLHALFTSSGGLPGSEVRFLVLDEVDQLIARNLHDFVYAIVKLLPPPRSRPLSNVSSSTTATAGAGQTTFTSPFEPGNPVVSALQNTSRRFSSAVPSSTPPNEGTSNSNSSNQPIERQTALFSNTVPQDVLNLASHIQLREPVRVLVRRDGNVANPEVTQNSRGLRQFYLYLAFQAGGRSDPLASVGGGLGIIGSGRSASTAETTQAREWKLDALADLLEDVEIPHAVVHVGGMAALDAVVYKLAARGFEAIPLHGDMNSVTRVAALNKFRSASSMILKQPGMKVLVVYDIQLKSGEFPHVPLVVNYDLPKAVEEYSHRVSPAIAPNYSRAGIVVNFVTATGGDVEMLRSIECFYKIKCPEVPMSLRDIV
ncbi:hypothetical protein CPB83DRAFT_843068 [Crepidotus variabilis]|uniref:RNA helicase n=1 Tax=Crepidotus variabilis TaxID=179855 RepID=A0A9P6EUD7_9AGAR|nr:hypothetical protein CPB83DRAFT_843068 [Crepidotus variabilis]